jgi:hypothetical protein
LLAQKLKYYYINNQNATNVFTDYLTFYDNTGQTINNLSKTGGKKNIQKIQLSRSNPPIFAENRVDMLRFSDLLEECIKYPNIIIRDCEKKKQSFSNIPIFTEDSIGIGNIVYPFTQDIQLVSYNWLNEGVNLVSASPITKKDTSERRSLPDINDDVHYIVKQPNNTVAYGKTTLTGGAKKKPLKPLKPKTKEKKPTKTSKKPPGTSRTSK